MKLSRIISLLFISAIGLISCSKDTNTGSVRVNQEVQLYNFATSPNTLYIGVKQDTILKKCCAFYGDFIYYTDSINLAKRDTINKNLQLIDGVGNNLMGASATVPMDEMNNYLFITYIVISTLCYRYGSLSLPSVYFYTVQTISSIYFYIVRRSC